jgi:hypothetical protein
MTPPPPSYLNKFSWKWMFQEINPHLLGNCLLYFDQILDDDWLLIKYNSSLYNNMHSHFLFAWLIDNVMFTPWDTKKKCENFLAIYLVHKMMLEIKFKTL